MHNGYWDRTHAYLDSHGGVGPPCPLCGEEMFPTDDHGRFTCFCNMQEPMHIPQVDVTGMSDEEKARIPPINRLHAPMTQAEQKFASIAAHGVDAMDDPAYWMAGEAIDEERRRANQND